MEQINFGSNENKREGTHLVSFAKSSEEMINEKIAELEIINSEIDELEHSVPLQGLSQSSVNKFLLKFGIGKEKNIDRLDHLYKQRMNIERSVARLHSQGTASGETIH